MLLPPEFLEMCAADKVALVYAMRGAYPYALATAGALIVVDCCKIVYYRDSAVRTSLLTLTAGNTAVLTVLSCKCALVVIRALDNDT